MQNPTELASFLPSAISSISRETAEKINEDLAIFVVKKYQKNHKKFQKNI